MAYAALTSLAGVINQIQPHDQKYVTLCGKDQMKSLHEKVCLLQDFLEYVSVKTFLPDTDVLESRIRDTAYKMEDTIELVILFKPGEESENEVQLPTPDEFSSYFGEFQVLSDETMEMKKNLDNKSMSGKHPLTTTTLSRVATVSSGTKVGLEKALNQILDQVIGRDPTLRIVPITGMGGIGKTTLARASYEAPKTLNHFDVRFWVTVSQDYNIQEILRGLLPEAERSTHSDAQLIEYVHKHLKGRRFLIVLDDMWDEKVWDRMRNAFPDDNKGSRVILTTRSSRVASYVGSSSPVHEMQFLNEDQSWDLLRENVYGQEYCSPEFEDMGRMIARNCKGLPLAVVVIAGLLKFNKTTDYWEQVTRNTDEKATISNDHLFEILSWSYTRLPPHLKACFLYMGVYKEDYEIPRKELVWLWAAEGFLKPKQSRSMEEVAEECLEELVERSLVLVTKRSYNGRIRSCSVHDVVREVSIRKAEEEKFHHHSPDESTFRNVLTAHRRVGDKYELIDQEEHNFRSRRIVQSLKLLKVMNKARLEDDSQLSILCTLTNLRHLHFLSKSFQRSLKSEMVNVPASIGELQNLETLIIGGGWHTIFYFPSESWKLQRLKHIIVMEGQFAMEAPKPNQVCPNIQTLYGMNTYLTKSFVEIFPNLKKLKLKDSPGEVILMENLQYLHQLEELFINFNFHFEDNCHLPTNLVFPQNLKKLTLYGTYIPLENLSPIGLLPSLKVLGLRSGSVMGDEWEPNEGEFVQLECLKMDELRISHWRAEGIHFPRLRKVIISRCYGLEEVSESIGEIDTLETLIVHVFQEKVMRSVQKIKEIQRDMGNHLLQVIIWDSRSKTDDTEEGSDDSDLVQ